MLPPNSINRDAFTYNNVEHVRMVQVIDVAQKSKVAVDIENHAVLLSLEWTKQARTQQLEVKTLMNKLFIWIVFNRIQSSLILSTRQSSESILEKKTGDQKRRTQSIMQVGGEESQMRVGGDLKWKLGEDLKLTQVG